MLTQTWKRLVYGRQIARSEGGLHVLINNAGIFPLGPIELLAEEVRLTRGSLPSSCTPQQPLCKGN